MASHVNHFNRVLLLLLDGVGIGELPDACQFGDEGSHTLGNLCSSINGLTLPTLQSLGLGNIENLEGIRPAKKPKAAFGKMMEVSAGKDSTTGHWEIAGLITSQPFPTYPDGFPAKVVDQFKTVIERDVLGNKAASGTTIIKELGKMHLESGNPIVYTSADSVFQIAAHEDVVPVEQLYEWCAKARAILQGPNNIARVIARPFTGTPGSFRRTPLRKDFSLPPHDSTLLDHLNTAGHLVITIGKVDELFDGRGIKEAHHIVSNAEGMRKTLELVRHGQWNLLWTTLVDFDTMFGHRNDVSGFAEALCELDAWIPSLLNSLADDDLLIITADHGNDPTTPGSDHSREYVPLLVYHKLLSQRVSLGVRKSFTDIAATIGQNFAVKTAGSSFLDSL